MSDGPEIAVAEGFRVLLAHSAPGSPSLLRNLRLVTKACCAISDAARDEVQVSLPSCPPTPDSVAAQEQRLRAVPSPQHVGGLLRRLRTLTHATICQEHEEPEPDLNVATAVPASGRTPCSRGPCCCSHCYWRAALSGLQPRHLRRLQLEGLVVLLLPPPAGGSARPRGGMSAPTGAAGLLAELLVAAPGLQELALLDVRMVTVVASCAVGTHKVSDGSCDRDGNTCRSCRTCGIDGAGCDSDEGRGSSAASGASTGGCACAGAGLGPVLAALPSSLTSLQLSLCPAAAACAAPCASCCLGSALRRLTRLQRLELSGLAAETVLAAMHAALSPDAAPSNVPPHGLTAAPQPGSGPNGAATACAAAAPAAPPVALPEAAAAAAAPLPLSGLQRLLLDVEGHLDLDQLRHAVGGSGAMPRLQHLTLVEHREQHPHSCAQVPRGPPASTRVAVDAAAQLAAQPSASKRFLPLGSVLWLLQMPRPDLRRLSFSTDRSFTALPQPKPQTPAQAQASAPAPAAASVRAHGSAAPAAAVATPAPTGAAAASARPRGASGAAPLRSVRLVLDLSAEALQPLVAVLPRGLDSLTLHVGALHRPADTLAVMTAAADEAAAAAAAAAVAVQAADGPVGGAVGGAGANTGAPTAPPPPPLPPAPAPPPPPSLSSARTSTAAANAAANAAAASAASLLPPHSPQPDSPAWLSVPPDSFLGGMRWLWPALTALPALLPALRELRLGGQLPTADHVLRCWAAAAGDPASLVTPMVTDPAFNAMVLRSEQEQREQRRREAAAEAEGARRREEEEEAAAVEMAQDAARAVGGNGAVGGGGSAGAGAAAPRQLDRRMPLGAGSSSANSNSAFGHNNSRNTHASNSSNSHSGAVARAGAATIAAASASAAGAAAGLPYGMAWSGWGVSLERVCLGSAGPSVSAALHLRRFMPALRRLQVVVDGRLRDVAVACSDDGGDDGGGDSSGAGATGAAMAGM